MRLSPPSPGVVKLIKTSLRNKFVTFKDTPWMVDKEWLSGTPKAIRQQAVFEVVKNFKVAFTDNAHDNIDKFKMSYKKKKTQCTKTVECGNRKGHENRYRCQPRYFSRDSRKNEVLW
eukprot:scaffold840_cov344-Pavlova_lutheri.AAC.12